MLRRCCQRENSEPAGGPRLLAGTGSDATHLLIVTTSDRGLCGAFNSSIARTVRTHIADLGAQGKTVKILCVGRKGRDQLRREYGKLIVDTIEEIGKPKLEFAAAEGVDVLWMPSVEEMYPDGFATAVEVDTSLTGILDGDPGRRGA